MAKVLTFIPTTTDQLDLNLRGYAEQAKIEIPEAEYLGLSIQGDQLIAVTDFEGSGVTVAVGDFQKLVQLHDQLMTPDTFRPTPKNASPKRTLSPQKLARQERGLRRAQRHHAKKASRND